MDKPASRRTARSTNRRLRGGGMGILPFPGGVNGAAIADRLDDLLSHADLSVASIDRAGADVFPAIAVVGRVARGADDDGAGRDRLAADLADRRAGLLV